ncbi:MAG: ASCH domain-containing protein [archaeon]
MKALSLKQPFAELILQGKKKIEIRKWNTKFRGEFLIHASKIPDNRAMKKFGFNKLPLGCIVGKANLKGVKKYKDAKNFKKDYGFHLATEEFGNYGFILKNVKRIEQIKCNGFLGFWDYFEST